MAGYIGSKSSVTLVDGYSEAEADAEFVTKTGDSMTGNLSLGDNNKAIFGAGSDLQIYHDGSHSYIAEGGSATGSLRIRGENLLLEDNSGKDYLNAVADAQVELSYNGSKKFETTSTGIAVTGNIANASGNFTLDVAGNIILDADGGDVVISDAGTEIAHLSNSNSDFKIESKVSDKDIIFRGNDGGSGVTALTIDMSAGGAVNMPTQPAFQCRCTTDNQNNLAINTHHTVAFSADERFDVAGNFASNTFTAPVTGKYMMAIVVYLLNLDSAANYVEVSLITSNQNYHAILETSSFASDAQYTTVPISVLVDMDFDDTAFVRVYQSAGAAQMDIANSSYFSGYLVA
jgi:hypothetical protein